MTPFDHLLGQLRAAGEATRLRGLLLLAHGDLTVTELTVLLDQSQPRVSRHLKLLAEAGLVTRYQEGAWVFYRLADPDFLRRLGADPAAALPQADMDALEALRTRRVAAANAYFAAHAADWESLRSRYIDESEVSRGLRELAGGPVETFLDLGTGTGQMLLVFAEDYRRGYGIDLSPEMLNIARAKLISEGITHAQVRRADFLGDPLPDGAHIVCLHHVLHFLAEPERALRVAADALAGNGRILIADFAPHDHEDLRETHAHRRLGFSDEEIERWAGACRLRLTATTTLDAPVEGGLTTKLWRLEGKPVRRRTDTRSISDGLLHVGP
jgi:ArsR family transcriptional regulator